MTQKKFTVPDMSCAHCKAAIEESLGELSGVANANADPDSKQVEVSYDEGRVSTDQIKVAIEEAGYTVAA